MLFYLLQVTFNQLSIPWYKFDGNFSYDEKNPSAAKITVNIDTSSIDSNHAERDKHLRGEDFLDVKKYPEARFISTSFEEKKPLYETEPGVRSFLFLSGSGVPLFFF